MITRAAAVLALAERPGATPPGVDAETFRVAMLEDVYEMVAGLALTDAVLALHPGPQPSAVAVTWPGTPVVTVGPEVDDRALLAAVLAEVEALGYAEVAVVSADAPDLPAMLVGKLWRSLGRSEVAVCPSEGGGLVAFAARLPCATWLAESAVGLDTPDALNRLRAAAPGARRVAMTPGWHRLRTPGDLSRLDPGLEGWDATRAVLAGRRRAGAS